MNWFRHLFSQQNPYGYWVTSEAQAIPVDNEAGHLDALSERGLWTYNEAFEQGWVRLVTGIKPGAVNAWAKPTKQQIMVILDCFEKARLNKPMVSTHWYTGFADVYFELEKALQGRLRSPTRTVPQAPDYVGRSQTYEQQQEELKTREPAKMLVGS